jgi:hypothetical protein
LRFRFLEARRASGNAFSAMAALNFCEKSALCYAHSFKKPSQGFSADFGFAEQEKLFGLRIYKQ